MSIKCFSAAYGESSDLVLKGITLDICPERSLAYADGVEVVKSSLLASFFHLLEYQEGFIAIDGQDRALLPWYLHRQRLNCMTQDSCWVRRESVRFNVDPRAEHFIDDSEATTALTKCQVWD